MSEVQSAIKALIDGDGFTTLEGLIPKESAASVRKNIIDSLDEGNETSPGDISLTRIIAKGLPFTALATHPRLLAVAHRLLGQDCKLAALSARVLMPGCAPGTLHIDYPYWAMDPGMPVNPALMLQVIWMMESFSEANGSTWVAPGSQKYLTHVDSDRFAKEAIQLKGNAGDAIISHGLLWHRTAVNHSDQPRVAVLINYSQLSIRPMRELGPFSDSFLKQASPELKDLLALDYWRSLQKRLMRNYS